MLFWFISSWEQSCSRVALASGGTQTPQEARDVTSTPRPERLLSELAAQQQPWATAVLRSYHRLGNGWRDS